jgi:Asp/Glu/hydantoin racemase
MRLLIVNPNTSAGVTARIRAAAEDVAKPGDQFTTVSAASGPALIVTEADAEAAVEGVLQAVAAHCSPIDGIVLASFGDTGAHAVRRRYQGLPVMGIAEAAFNEVRRIGGPFAIVTFAPELVGSLAEKAVEHGVSEALMKVASPGVPLSFDPAVVADELLPVLRDLCRSCDAEGAHSIVLGGGPLAGVANRLSDCCNCVLVDGTQSAVSQLRAELAADEKSPPI